MRLWYDKPSSKGTNILRPAPSEDNTWQQHTLPIGNGDLGANVYGEIVCERLTFNEKTLWTGGPCADRPDYNGGNLEECGKNGETMKKIQELFAAGNSDAASELCNELIGANDDGYGAYQSWGNLYFDSMDLTEEVSDYVRDLDLTTAVASVKFSHKGTDYTREFFISHPDNVLVGRLTAIGAAPLNVDVRFVSNQECPTVALGTTLEQTGRVRDNQMQFAACLSAVAEGGSVIPDGDKLTVRGASALTVYLSAATDYKNEYPAYRTGESAEDLHARVRAVALAASKKPYEQVKADHIADYQSLYGRVALDLGQSDSEKPTDLLLEAYRNGTASAGEERLCEVALFQFGRYLTIASSREDSQLPSNLQGVWNNRNNPPWHADYHLNVNLQMNYWPACSANLAECTTPLLRYVESLRKPGRETARIYAGIESTPERPENGFMAHTQNTPFGWTCPGWEFLWGWSPAAVPWILQNCRDYYEFTEDVDALRTWIYPAMKESAVLYDQMLVRDEDGKLVSSPTSSPEHGPRTHGNTYEQSLIWQLYEDTVSAAEALGVDSDLVAVWKSHQSDLKGPIEIGTDGQIKEWYSETSLNSVQPNASGHRHMSHMLGMFPGNLIQRNPAWVEGARVSMADRTNKTTGWGLAQRINTWARLRDGEMSHGLIRQLFQTGIFPNLWDTCPPFQIDGNFGYTAGVAEILLQSNLGYADVLPALPEAWKTGSVKGLKARGNFTFDFAWRDGRLTSLSVQSAGAKTLRLRLPAGQRPESDAALERDGDCFVYSFPEAGTLTLRFSMA
ncbi:MAG: glycoside hydrolase family 95 protein [Clostridia bacterium]|nr:glycoside hydrolase family 95 protein [Clostridia bacterium]